jgi:hypothetical protein
MDPEMNSDFPKTSGALSGLSQAHANPDLNRANGSHGHKTLYAFA